MAIDVASLIDPGNITGALNKGLASINQSTADLTQAVTGGQAALTRKGAAATSEGAANSDLAIAQGLADAKKDKDIANLTAAFGTNPDAASYVLEVMGKKIQADEQDIHKRRDSIQQKLDTGFFDNPLEYIVNQFTLPNEIAAANNKIVGVDRDRVVLSDLMNKTTLAGQNMAVLDNINAADKAEALSKVALARAEQNASNAEYEVKKLGIEGITARANLNHQALQDVFQANQTLATLENLQLNQAHLRLAESSLDLAKQREGREKDQFELVKRARDEDFGAQRAIEKKLEGVTAVLGIKKMSYLEYSKLSPAMRQTLDTYMGDPAFDEDRAGTTPAAALRTLNSGNWPGNPGLNVPRTRLTEIASETAKNTINWHQLKPDEQDMLINKRIKELVPREQALIPSEGGLYSPGSLYSVLTKKAVQNTAPTLVADMSNMAVANKQYKTDATDVFTHAMALVKDGKMSAAAAATEISNMYKAIVLDVNEAGNYKRLALPRLQDFKTAIHTGVSWEDTKTIDMTNRAAVEAVLTRTIIMRKKQEEYQQFQETGVGRVINEPAR